MYSSILPLYKKYVDIPNYTNRYRTTAFCEDDFSKS
jgi:hypothetical protein